MSLQQIDLGAGVAHSASAGAVLLGWLSWMVGFYPATIVSISTTVALCFYLTQLYESHTVQTWFKNRRRRKMHRLQREIDALHRASVRQDQEAE